MPSAMPAPNSFDHVALWVADRDAISDLLCRTLGHHIIDRTDNFTLVGPDAREGKLTLFDAGGPRSAGPLERIAFRVCDLGRAADAFRDAGIGGTPDDLHGPEG